jgi:GH15 family glucan-1,4-alpha-glucosidase
MGRHVWACMPRFDSEPFFSALIDGENPERGFFDVELQDFERSEQYYDRNTAILTTRLHCCHGSIIEITDFAPRFANHGRNFRPTSFIRRIRPVAGEPFVTIRLRPTAEWGAGEPSRTRGSNHIRYVGPDHVMRLTTNAPVAYILDETGFLLQEPIDLLLGPDESLTDPLNMVCARFEEETREYWRNWSRSLSIPFEWQDEVIRAAITLKMCAFEETGAVIAALTTSIPEHADSGRNWDYRYCWLRDAYFVVQALNRLGATKTMEGLIHYISNIVARSAGGHIQPVYGITTKASLDEWITKDLAGYRNMGPVRVGNQACEHIQNDVYGQVILVATQAFFDKRLFLPDLEALFDRLELAGEQAWKLYDQPDAGLWEFRTIAQVHTYSAAMCWAGCDRMARIAAHLGRKDRHAYWRERADIMRSRILDEAWNAEINSFADAFGGSNVDASLLQLADIGLVEAEDPRFVGTVEAVGRELKRGQHVFRYISRDDFGEPETAFNVCTFWYIEALCAIGRLDEARELYEAVLKSRNHLGLLSEDIDPSTGELWGNFPQTYSMVGMITCATLLSRKWKEAL